MCNSLYISEITGNELEDTKDEALKKKFRKLIEAFSILKINNKARDLAQAYVSHGIFPEKYIDDALYVAIATS